MYISINHRHPHLHPHPHPIHVSSLQSSELLYQKKHPNVFKPLPVPDLPGLGLAEHNGYFSTEATQISKDRGLEH